MITVVGTSTPAYLRTTHRSNGYVNGQSNSTAGMVRYNPNVSAMEVWDGNTWVNISASSEVSLTEDTIELLEWARKERSRQRQYEALAKNNVTIADAIESVKDAELRLRELAILCETSETNNTI